MASPRLRHSGMSSPDRVPLCVESGTGAHIDDATVCWVYQPEHWGLCGQGSDEASAVEDLRGRALESFEDFLSRHGASSPAVELAQVVERIHGEEEAFELDREPATDEDLERTLTMLRWARQDLLSLVTASSPDELDWVDAERVMPSWATWRTARLTAWHVADTESRYYLAMLDVPPPPRADDLLVELTRSQAHVASRLPGLPRDLVVERGGEVWTTRKILRRLAWHERGEIDAIREHLTHARRAL